MQCEVDANLLFKSSMKSCDRKFCRSHELRIDLRVLSEAGDYTEDWVDEETAAKLSMMEPQEGICFACNAIIRSYLKKTDGQHLTRM